MNGGKIHQHALNSRRGGNFVDRGGHGGCHRRSIALRPSSCCSFCGAALLLLSDAVELLLDEHGLLRL
jgi:hypothetical protein